jgi:hypothetical protein
LSDAIKNSVDGTDEMVLCYQFKKQKKEILL